MLLTMLSRAAESTKFQRLRLRLRLGKIDSDSNFDSDSNSDPHQSLLSHVEGQCYKTVVSSLRNAFDAKYCLQARQQNSLKVCQDLVLYIGGGGVNYPGVNQNDLSDRTLSLVKVDCVMKTTDRTPSLRTFTAQNITMFQ